MAAEASNCLLLLFFLLSVSSSGGLAQKIAPMAQKRINHLRISNHEEINPLTPFFPTAPMSPLPPAASTPTVFTVPTITPGAVPATPAAVPGGRPVSTPVMSSPVIPGQSWCVAKAGTPPMLLQAALDYACGIGGSDCSPIQLGGICFYPNTLESHASFAFNSYFQKVPMATSCDFGGTAAIVNTNPSTGSCIYSLSLVTPSQSSPSSPPATPNPVPMPTPTTVFPPPSPVTTSPPYPFTTTPPYPFTTSPPYPFTTSPPYPVTTTPPYPVTTTPPYPVTTTPPYQVTTSPPYPATISPPYPLTTTPPSSGSGPTVLNMSSPASESSTTTTTGFGSENHPASPTSRATASPYNEYKIIGILLLAIPFL